MFEITRHLSRFPATARARSSRCGPRRAVVLLLVVAVGLLTAACSSGTPAAKGTDKVQSDGAERTVVRWFVGLGTGSRREQIAPQEEIVRRFNASQDRIQLELEIVDNEVAYSTLSRQIAAGSPPDLIGPVGVRGANAFAGRFLNLEPLISSTGFDLAAYDPTQINIWREPDGELTALPIGSYPSVIFYNKTLFDRAGLPYPPDDYGEFYNGSPWTMEKLTELALLLTLDANGNNATSPAFDPEHVVQWGFHHQNGTDARAQGSLFGAGDFVAADGSAQIPAPWLAEWQWYHDLIWKHRAAPSRQHVNSALLKQGNAFGSGNVAMAFTHLWYTSVLRDAGGRGANFFDLAVVPSYQGSVTSKLHADTFRILDSTRNPEAVFTVLRYLLTEAAPELLPTYGSLPARRDLRATFFDDLDRVFPQKVAWTAAAAGLAHPDVPSHEGPLPNFNAAQARIEQFEALLISDPAINVAVEAERLRSDLSTIFAKR